MSKKSANQKKKRLKNRNRDLSQMIDYSIPGYSVIIVIPNKNHK